MLVVPFMLVGSKDLRPPAPSVWPAILTSLLLVAAVAGITALVYTLQRDLAPPTKGGVAPLVFFAPGGSPAKAIVERLNAARLAVQTSRLPNESGNGCRA